MTHDMTQSIISRQRKGRGGGRDESGGGLSPLHRFLAFDCSRIFLDLSLGESFLRMAAHVYPRIPTYDTGGVHIKYHPLVIARLEQEEHSRPPSMKNEG